jgi:hypothetical protein
MSAHLRTGDAGTPEPRCVAQIPPARLTRGFLAIAFDRKDVAVGVFEPGDFAAAGAG